MAQTKPSELLMSKNGTPHYGRDDGVATVYDTSDASTPKGMVSVFNGIPGRVLSP